ncbi:MAG: YceI family protein [Pseudomonadota bacterium]
MTTLRLISTLIALTVATTATADLASSPAGKYTLDKNHGYITFSYNHLGFSTPQVGFDDWDVVLNLDNGNVESSTVEVMIDATSINSRVAVFNGHLTGENFFNTSEYPDISFVSKSIESRGDDAFDVAGDLTIKGVTKPVVLAMKVNKADNHPMRKVPTIGVSGEAKVNRSEFGLDRAVPAVGDEVTISVSAELVKADD